MKKIYSRFMMLFLSIAILFSVPPALFVPLGPMTADAAEVDRMEVHFLDVGQGDATLITCGGHHMLIDAGDDTKGTWIQNYLQKRGVKSFDYLILTHPDSDHIGGAPVIITKFAVDQVFMSDYKKEDKTYEKLIQALDHKRLRYTTPVVGAQYTLGTATITILAPGKTYDDPNNASIALIVQNGKDRFLFTGDAEEEAEADILKNDQDISADVYQAGHHGSKTSTSEAFFKAVKPACAVISCGEDNAYGHPHAQTLDTFRRNGVKVYRTDEEGTVIATSDGNGITFDVPPSETWKAGEPTGSGAGRTSGVTYVLNRNTKKFHRSSCSSVETIKDKNREDTTMARDAIINAGFVPCKKCDP